MTTVTEHLAAAYGTYCRRHGLPEISADELLCEVAGSREEWLQHETFLRAFVVLWDEAQADDDEAAR